MIIDELPKLYMEDDDIEEFLVKRGINDIIFDVVHFRFTPYLLQLIYSEDMKVVPKCQLEDIISITPVWFDDNDMRYIIDLKDGDLKGVTMKDLIPYLAKAKN